MKSIRRSGYTCLECSAVTWATTAERHSASRLRCSGCGSLSLLYTGKGIATPKGDRAEALKSHQKQGDCRDSERETRRAIDASGYHPRRPGDNHQQRKADSLPPTDRARYLTAILRRQRADFLARKKHGLLKPELRRNTNANP